jgi:hypothetical protein
MLKILAPGVFWTLLVDLILRILKILSIPLGNVFVGPCHLSPWELFSCLLNYIKEIIYFEIPNLPLRLVSNLG